MTQDIFTVEEKAQSYITDLLKKRGVNKVCLFVENPNTPNAETCLCYFDDLDESDKQEEFEEHAYAGFAVCIKLQDKPYLQDATIGIIEDDFGSQLTIKAPNAKSNKLKEGASTEEQIKHILVWEINPSLAAHGGFVKFVALEQEGSVAVLEFGGGCQGCSMIDATLKEGVEGNLISKIPALKAVKDVTDHNQKEGAYY